MTTIHRFFSKALASLMLAGLCLCFVNSAKAQCPTDIPPTSGPGSAWSGPMSGGSFLIPGTTDCFATYTYCTRTIGGVVQVYIEGYGPDPLNWGSDCSSILWTDLLNIIRERVFQRVSTDPCSEVPPHIVTTVSVYSGQCVKMQINGAGYPWCAICSGAYCKKTCDLCGDGHGHNIESNCVYSVLGTGECDTEIDWGTITVGAVQNNQWGYIFDHCYFLGCNQE